MANIDDLDKAIGDHGIWITHLKSAIETGIFDTPIEIIRMDNQCEFGKWLYGSKISSRDKSSTHYKTVKLLHSEFHRTAALVADLVQKDKKDEALQMIAVGGEYTKISSKLIQAMTEWKLVLNKIS
jgi:hypothetical protein